MPDGSAAKYWEQHLASLAEHERSLYSLQEQRAQILAGLCGSLAAGGTAWLTTIGWFDRAGTAAQILMFTGLLAVLVAAAVFWLTLSPMEGRRFHRGSLTDHVHRMARTYQEGGLQGFFRSAVDQDARRARRLSENLAAEARAAAEAEGLKPADLALSPAARSHLVDWLKNTVRSDLRWWLELDNDTPEARHDVEARVRMVFWFWTNRQVAEAKAEMVRTGISIGAWSVVLVTAALVTHLLGWWMLLGVGLIAAVLTVRHFLSRPDF